MDKSLAELAVSLNSGVMVMAVKSEHQPGTIPRGDTVLSEGYVIGGPRKASTVWICSATRLNILLKDHQGTEGDKAEEQYHHQDDHQQERVAAHLAHSFPSPLNSVRNLICSIASASSSRTPSQFRLW